MRWSLDTIAQILPEDRLKVLNMPNGSLQLETFK